MQGGGSAGDDDEEEEEEANDVSLSRRAGRHREREEQTGAERKSGKSDRLRRGEREIFGWCWKEEGKSGAEEEVSSR